MISEIELDNKTMIDYKRKHEEHKRRLGEKIKIIKTKIK